MTEQGPLPGAIRDFQRVVLDALAEGLVVQDSSGEIVYANPAAARILELDSEDMMGRTSKDARWGAVGPDGEPLPDDDHPIVRARITGRPVRDALIGVHRPTGERRWLEVNAAPLFDDPTEPPVGAVGMFSDVTDELASRKALRTSEERFRTAVETMHDGFMILRAVRAPDEAIVDFACEFANEAVVRNGYLPANPVGQHLADFSPALREEFFGSFVDVVERGEPLRTEVPWIEDGSVLATFDVSGVRMGDGVALSFRDISRRVQDEQALRESEAQTRRFLEAIPVGVAIIEPGSVVFANEPFRRILGDIDTDVRGTALVEHFNLRRAGTDEPYPFDELPLVRAFFGGEATTTDDIVVVRDDGEIPVEGYAAPVRDESGEVRFALTILRDISERRAQEEELVRAHAELAAANAELTEFATVAAHDLAAPLRTVAGLAGLLETAYGATIDAQGQEWLAAVISESARMRALIEDLLVFARAGAATAAPTSVDLDVVAREACGALQAEIAGSGAVVEIAELPTVTGEATGLGQVLQNLLANALKFHAPGRAPEVSVDALREGSDWVVRVSDRGVGVGEGSRDRIFAPFYRGSAAPEAAGHGLGLSICRRIVDRHDGRMWCEPREGGGSRFCVALPGEPVVHTANSGSPR